MDVKKYIERVRDEFWLGKAELASIAAGFRKALEDGLAGRPSPLRMLPSYISEPSGSEKGTMLAVDFGGTNVRVIQVALDGAGGSKIEKILKFPLKAPDGSYNYVSAKARGEDLFDYIAAKIAETAPGGSTTPLGHTFSFPCEQKGLNSAFLINWTKEICTAGVEGADVTVLLCDALRRKGVSNVRPVAVINDTVGTLLAAGYADRDADIASICGTGHNTCYLEPRHPLTGKPMVVNMESGNFDGAPQTEVDRQLDQMSEMPGRQKLEKMLSGYYLGEIVRLALLRMVRDGILPACPALDAKHVVRGQDIDAILADGEPLLATAAFAADRLGLAGLDRDRLEAVKAANDGIAKRSARLVAATFAGTLDFIDPGLARKHSIAIDGSLYEKMPGYGAGIAQALSELYGDKARNVRTVLAKDGSGIGAAIAAAVASKALR
jgi:hexokinase